MSNQHSDALVFFGATGEPVIELISYKLEEIGSRAGPAFITPRSGFYPTKVFRKRKSNLNAQVANTWPRITAGDVYGMVRDRKKPENLIFLGWLQLSKSQYLGFCRVSNSQFGSVPDTMSLFG
jgi:hypothetical protein